MIMKTIVRISLFLVAVTLMLCKSTVVEEEAEDDDSVVEAQEQNEAASIDESVSDFLTEAADARMMDLAQGRLAVKRGTTEDIRQYGALMIKDQARLLDGIQKLAKAKKVALPKKISDEREEGLATLEEKTGKDFDKKFMQMITIDHRRDIRKFKNAGTIDDKDVAAFASKHLPTIENHLAQAKEIKTDL
jgi:putative membrane protein